MLTGKLDNELNGASFDTLDTNGVGLIDLAEWRLHYECHGLPVEHAKASFDAMDTNQDGLISRSEYLGYCAEYFLTTEDKLKSSLLFGPLD